MLRDLVCCVNFLVVSHDRNLEPISHFRVSTNELLGAGVVSRRNSAGSNNKDNEENSFCVAV